MSWANRPSSEHLVGRAPPKESLTDRSDDGLGLVRRLADEAPAWLRRRGWVLVEVSPDLSRSVAAILRRGGLTDVRSHRDSLGATRVDIELPTRHAASDHGVLPPAHRLLMTVRRWSGARRR